MSGAALDLERAFVHDHARVGIAATQVRDARVVEQLALLREVSARYGERHDFAEHGERFIDVAALEKRRAARQRQGDAARLTDGVQRQRLVEQA